MLFRTVFLKFQIVLSYTTGGQHSSFLYLTSVLVDEFGEQLDCRVGLVNVYEVIFKLKKIYIGNFNFGTNDQNKVS